ncbi:hypothetical protein BJX76DRAFT_364151 [Aspergillus varians]
MLSAQQKSDPPPCELLKYLPEYQVVICTRCHYAVQPHAISRHLKEIHHILRNRRRKFDQYVSGLNLRGPQDVGPPTQTRHFPVPDLPVEPGLRCLAAGCNHLCASSRRMQTHWQKFHGRKGYPTQDWCPTPLQTFFRGNLLRYFTRPEVRVALRNESLSAIPMRADDSALLDHYFKHTYQTFVTSPETKDIWLREVPNLATQTPFLLHGILACTALHQAYLTSDQIHKESYILRACTFQDLALPGFRSAITSPTPENSPAILAFALLLVVYSFASISSNEEPNSEEDDSRSLFLINTIQENNALDQHTILPNWLYIMRGGCHMLREVSQYALHSPVGAIFDAFAIHPDASDHDASLLAHLLSAIPPPEPPENQHHTPNPWPKAVVTIYTQAATHLARSFQHLRRTQQKSITTWSILRVWPMEVSMEYMSLLREQHPGALILLAHYCVLLKYMEGYWYFEGKAKLLILRIWRRLEGVWRGFIQGAVGEVVGCDVWEVS